MEPKTATETIIIGCLDLEQIGAEEEILTGDHLIIMAGQILKQLAAVFAVRSHIEQQMAVQI